MGWLYAPGSEGWSWASSSPSVPGIELWVLLSGTPQPRPLSWRGWTTRPWIERLSGTISRPSMAQRSVERWAESIWSPPASHVSPPRPRASDSGPTTLDGSGLTSLASWASYDPRSCTLRTSQRSLFPAEEVTRSSPRLPVSGSMRSGMCFQRQESEPRTAVAGFSFSRGEYPTPSATPYGSSQNEGQVPHDRPSRGTPSLETWARQWPTPTATDARAAGSRNAPGSTAHDGVSLSDMVATGRSIGRSQPETWATPSSAMLAGYTKDPEKRQAPTAGGHTRGHEGNQIQRQIDQISSPSLPDPTPETPGPRSSGPGPTSRRLSPGFVEWLMGWPCPGWSDSTPSGTASYRSWLRLHSACLRIVLAWRKSSCRTSW